VVYGGVLVVVGYMMIFWCMFVGVVWLIVCVVCLGV